MYIYIYIVYIYIQYIYYIHIYICIYIYTVSVTDPTYGTIYVYISIPYRPEENTWDAIKHTAA